MKRPSSAGVIATIALIVALAGTAIARLGPDSVGTRQLNTGAVTRAKIANGSVSGREIAKRSLTRSDIDLKDLGPVPRAHSARRASVARSLGGHDASCPSRTTLIEAFCFDSAPSGPVLGVKAAADACARRGGYLPSTTSLYSVRNQLPLGNGTGPHAEFTDSYFPMLGSVYTTVVSEAGIKDVKLENNRHEIIATYEYTCIYPLVH